MAKKSGIVKFIDGIFGVKPAKRPVKRIKVKAGYKYQNGAKKAYSDYTPLQKELVKMAVKGKYEAFIKKLQNLPGDDTYKRANQALYTLLKKHDDIQANQLRYAKFPELENAVYNKMRQAYEL